jgi:hypothetical protein
MRLLRIALCAACLSFAGLRAADEEQKQQPEEIPDFNQLDEYTYVPKSTLSLSSRFFVHGPKTTYSGQGAIPSPFSAGFDISVPNVSRTYFDGMVSPDSRTIFVSSGVGEGTSIPIASDGRTNSWSYQYASQLQTSGDIVFNNYSAEITDTAAHNTVGTPGLGLELLMDRDMGKIGKHLKWAITAGFSIADIHSSSYASVPTALTTTTDTYDLFGQVPPAPPYTSPNTISQSVLTSTGGVITNTSGTTSTQQADQTILLGNAPLSRTVSTSIVESENRYFIEGAYYTLRIGPTLILPIGTHFKLSMSAGPDLLYSGSEFNVFETLPIEENPQIPYTVLYQKENTKILPGYYVDVDLRYDLTETAGFYVGGLVQGGGSYSQELPSGTGTSYSTKIDFSDQQGIKGGFTFRF